MKYLIYILFFLATPVFAYDIIPVNETEVMVKVDFQGKINPWKFESEYIWQLCKDGKDYSFQTDHIDCSQKTYADFITQRIQETEDGIVSQQESQANALTPEETAAIKQLAQTAVDAKVGAATTQSGLKDYILYGSIIALFGIIIYLLRK